MDAMPEFLLARLSAVHLTALERLRIGIGIELAATYELEVADHHESRGDDAQLFGFKLWKHLWFRLVEHFEDDPDITIVKVENSWQIRLGPLRIGIYKNGELEDQDAQVRHPGSSPMKRSYGERNQEQLVLFDVDAASQVQDGEAVGALNDLTVTHYGNPRDGLTKWYFGAERRSPGSVGWVWQERQPIPQLAPAMPGNVKSLRRPGRVPTFAEQPVEDVVTPRRRTQRDAQVDGDAG